MCWKFTGESAGERVLKIGWEFTELVPWVWFLRILEHSVHYFVFCVIMLDVLISFSPSITGVMLWYMLWPCVRLSVASQHSVRQLLLLFCNALYAVMYLCTEQAVDVVPMTTSEHQLTPSQPLVQVDSVVSSDLSNSLPAAQVKLLYLHQDWWH